MMAVPDNLLESKTCSSCHKFLSVHPLKEYCEGSEMVLKCGRCSIQDDGGFPCKYSFFDKQGLFKCVNRFDGCRQMLRLPEVLDHEKRCFSKYYACPVCPHRPNFPTFFLEKHFRSAHKQNVLDTNTFPIDLPVTGTNTLLYRLKDNLFFIESKSLTPISFSLNAFFLGNKRANSLTQKFTVQFGGKKIEMDTEPMCLVNDDNDSDGFKIHTPGLYKTAIVTVHLDLGELEFVLVLKTINTSTPAVMLPRQVFVLESMRMLRVYCEGASVIVDFPEGLLEFAMYCVVCARALPGIKMKQEVPRLEASVVLVKPDKFQYVCDQCKYYLKHQSPSTVLLPAGNVYPGFDHMTIWFSCVWSKWGCAATHNYIESLDSHELLCRYQIHNRCPKPQCTYVGSMLDLNAHFGVSHRSDSLCFTKTPYMVDRCYSESPTNIYIWAYYGFVWMELSPGETDDEYTIGIRQPETSKLPQGRLLLVEPKSGRAELLTDEMKVSWDVETWVYATGYFSGEVWLDDSVDDDIIVSV